MIKFFDDDPLNWEVIPDPAMTREEAEHIHDMWLAFERHPDKAIAPIAKDLKIDILTREGHLLVRDKIQDAVNIVTGHHLLLA